LEEEIKKGYGKAIRMTQKESKQCLELQISVMELTTQLLYTQLPQVCNKYS